MTARHSRPHISTGKRLTAGISRKASLAFGAVAAGTLALVPSVANADPQPTVEQVKAQLDQYYSQAADANEAFNAAQVAEQKLQGQITDINARMAQEQASIVQTQSQIGSLAAAQYRSGGSGIDPTMQLLIQSDPKAVIDVAGAVDRASQSNANALHAYADAKAKLQSESKDAATKLALLDKSTKDAAAKKKTFDDDVAKAKGLLDSMQAEQRRQLEAEQAQQQAAAQQAAQAQLAAAKAQAGSSSSSSPPSSSKTVGVPASNSRAAAAVAFAQAQIGKPYIFGATGPGGYDCSGLTMSAWKSAGVTIPRTATAQMQGLSAVPASAAQPGDLVFFYGDASYVNHVGLYIGGGMVIHASRPGSPIAIAPVSSMPVVSYARP